MQHTIVLTEAGLYSLILKSRKPIAKEFKRWVLTEVLPAIRKTGQYNLQDTIDKQKQDELEKALEESRVEIEALRTDYKPIITYHECDINQIDGSSVYIIHLKENDYKFGRTDGADKRLDTHLRDFTKLGCNPKLIKAWKCSSSDAMKITEGKIKRYARQNNILVKKYGQTEIVTTDNIDPFVEKINEYVSSGNLKYGENTEIRKLELINKGKELDNEKLRLQLEMMRLQFRQPTINELPQLNYPEDNIADIPIIPELPKTTDQIITEWIVNNPPGNFEQSSVYFNRWRATAGNTKLSTAKFNEYVKTQGYQNIRQKDWRVWTQA